MDNLLELYCVVDDFLKDFLPTFEKKLLESGHKKSKKSCSMSLSEIMTIMIYFHQMRFRDFKSFYTQYLKQHLNKEFPKLLSYNRFVESSYVWPWKGGVRGGTNVDGFRKLYPIPSADISSNPNLVQNVGY